jgi:glutamate racemase
VRTESFGEGTGRQLPFVIAPPLSPPLSEHPTSEPPLTGPLVAPRIVAAPRILVFDSGLGGLTVFREVARARPDARFTYVADDALFPYGAIEEGRLIERVVSLMARFIAEHEPDLVVIACNTASIQVLPALRRHFSVPFVGTVPAIKPACAASVSKHVAVLGTEATVQREYTQALIRQFAQGCAVKLVGSARLAGFAEQELAGQPVEDDLLRDEITPCFVTESNARTDTVVLACTHYPLLRERLEKLAPWPVRFVDPSPAIARRVVELVGPATAIADRPATYAVFTSGRDPAPALAAALAGLGIAATADASTVFP